MTEIWKSIPGTCKYEASNLGRIRSRFGVLKPVPRPDGRLTVRVTTREHGQRTKKIAHLVLFAFVGPRPEGMEVAHLNGVKTDNRLENLKYTTHIENVSHKKLHGTHQAGERAPTAKLKWNQVRTMRKLHIEGISITQLATQFKISYTQVWNIIRNYSWVDPAGVDKSSETKIMDQAHAGGHRIVSSK